MSLFNSVPTPDGCPHCKERREENYIFCDFCDNRLWVKETLTVTGIAQIKGYTSGYNEGLGVHIKSKKHYKEVLKEQGAVPNG